MTKPQLIQWLEEETGQQLDRVEAPTKARHVSIRVSDDLFGLLDATAVAHGETVSQCARRLLEGGLVPRSDPVAAIDDAIVALQRARSAIEEVADPLRRG